MDYNKLYIDNVIRYGNILTDDDYISSNGWYGLRFALRIRIIEFEKDIYYHKMINGEVVEFKKI